MTKNSKENRARSCPRLVNDEAVIEVVAVLLLYHVQLLEAQVHVEDGLKTVYNLTEIVIEEVWQWHTIFSRNRPIINPIGRHKVPLRNSTRYKVPSQVRPVLHNDHPEGGGGGSRRFPVLLWPLALSSLISPLLVWFAWCRNSCCC